jgi:phosphoglycerate dehydrogenase-like enzyme
VFETHPVTPANPLLDLDNVVLTPHLGGATEETIARHSAMMADDILLFADGHRPRNLVNPEAWERRG